MKTIIALATNVENSAISLIRISGDKSFQVFNKLVKDKRIKEKRLVRKLYINDKFVDEVVVNFFDSPNSFTGNDVIEIMCHANKYIIDDIFNFFLSNGCSNAKPGEFLEQSYLNKKISIIESQNINEIIKANNRSTLNIYREGFESNRNYIYIKRVRKTLTKLMMESDMQIEYPEYETSSTNKEVIKVIKTMKSNINREIEQLKKILLLDKGFIVSLVGDVNLGKSSLFNKLSEKNRAIVTDHPGTTRDYIKEKIVTKNNTAFFLVDTAGFNKNSEEIEEIGIKKTNEVIKESNLIINFSKRKIKSKVHQIQIIPKSDLVQNKDKSQLYVSSKTNEGVNDLILYIENFIKKEEDKIKRGGAAFKSGEKLLLELYEKLKYIENEITSGATIDIFRSNLDDILEIINTLLGENEAYSYYQEIFRKFCIGK